MKLRHALTSSALAAALAACGPPSAPKEPDPPSAATSAASAPASAEPAAPPAAPEPPAAPSKEASPHESLARDLVKSGGRRIAFSAGKKRFLVPIEMRSGGGRGLDLRLYDDDGNQRENQRVCQPGECEDKLDEIAKELIPKLAERLEREGYEAVSAVGWPSGREEIELSTLGVKLRFDKGKLTIPREKKPPTALRGKAPKADAIEAVYPVAAQKLLGAFAKGDKTVQDFFVFKLP